MCVLCVVKIHKYLNGIFRVRIYEFFRLVILFCVIIFTINVIFGSTHKKEVQMSVAEHLYHSL